MKKSFILILLVCLFAGIVQGQPSFYQRNKEIMDSIRAAKGSSFLRNDTVFAITITGVDTTFSIRYKLPITAATQAALDTKQATLVSATNIKTVNGSSILGSGNLSISSAVAWGEITGTLSDQTDLQNALNLKATTATTDSMRTNIYTAINGKQAAGSYLVAADITGKANLASPTFTGTVSGITAAMVGLGSATNESKATMFTNATFTGTFNVADGSIANADLANAAVANLSGTNTGDNAVNSTYASDYRAANFVAGTNYLAPTGSAAALTSNTGGWTTLRVSGSDFTTTSTSLVDITGLVTSTLSTATLYEFEAVLYVNSTTTAGMAIGVQQSGTGSGQIGVFSGTATNAAATGIAIGSNALNTASAPCVLVNGDGSITIKGYVKTGSSGSPTIVVKILKTTGGTARIYIGSVLRYRLAQ